VMNRGWGLLTEVRLPGGGKLGVYQPRHARPKTPAAPASRPGPGRPARKDRPSSAGAQAGHGPATPAVARGPRARGVRDPVQPGPAARARAIARALRRDVALSDGGVSGDGDLHRPSRAGPPLDGPVAAWRWSGAAGSWRSRRARWPPSTAPSCRPRTSSTTTCSSGRSRRAWRDGASAPSS
jgi:hypothetical protein